MFSVHLEKMCILLLFSGILCVYLIIEFNLICLLKPVFSFDFMFVVVWLPSCVQLFVTTWTAACQAPCLSLSLRDCLGSCPLRWWCYLIISSSVIPFPFSFRLSQHQSLFQWVGSSHQVAKVLAFQLQHQSSQWTQDWFPLGLFSFRIDWFHLLTLQGSLKSLLQQHSSKASIIWCSAFFTVQLSHPCMTTGKTIALTRQTFVGKITSLLLIYYLGWS